MADALENAGALTAEENAYFESGGNAPLEPGKKEPEAEGQHPESEAAGQEQNRDEKGRFVPHQALHAEREEHKKTKSQLQELQNFRAVMEDRWNTLLKAGEKPKEEDSPPDPSVDIFAYSQWQAKQLEKLNGKISEREKQENEARETAQRENAIWSHWQRSRAEYSSSQADFDAAAQFLSDARNKQLQALSIVDPRMSDQAVRDQQINAELRQIILASHQQGRNPAEAVYQIAQQYGYAPAQQQTTPTLPDKLGKIASAQEAAKTIGQANARGGADEVTLASVMAMDRAEFDTWISEPKNRKLFDKLMGG